MEKVKLNFARHKAAQDMIKLIEKKKGLSTSEAITFCVNYKIFCRILDTGWASIALPIWGHGEDDPDRRKLTLDNPRLEIDFDEKSLKMIREISKQEEVNLETVVSYFLLFTMEILGYHI